MIFFQCYIFDIFNDTRWHPQKEKQKKKHNFVCKSQIWFFRNFVPLVKGKIVENIGIEN